MKARVKEQNGMWVGQVYGEWVNTLFNLKQEGWKTVTDLCFTRVGAKLALRAWKSKHMPKEFEI